MYVGPSRKKVSENCWNCRQSCGGGTSSRRTLMRILDVTCKCVWTSHFASGPVQYCSSSCSRSAVAFFWIPQKVFLFLFLVLLWQQVYWSDLCQFCFLRPPCWRLAALYAQFCKDLLPCRLIRLAAFLVLFSRLIVVSRSSHTFAISNVT